jgi:vaccinia related kinase
LTKTQLRIKENNTIHISSLLVNNASIESIITNIIQDPNTFIDSNKQIWIAGKKKGSGGFSTVYECKNNQNVVIKYVKKYTNDESQIYTQLGTSQLVPMMYGCGVKNDWDFIVLSKYKWDLHSILSSKFPNRETILRIIVDIIKSLEYIHKRGYIHCDIKLKNIFVDYKYNAVLGDFGLSKPIKQTTNPANRGGTLVYMSTDIHDKKYPTKRSDLESLGWNLIRLFGGSLSWEKSKSISEISICKILAKNNIDNFLLNCKFNNSDISQLKTYLTLVWKLDYNQDPDYSILQKTFE